MLKKLVTGFWIICVKARKAFWAFFGEKRQLKLLTHVKVPSVNLFRNQYSKVIKIFQIFTSWTVGISQGASQYRATIWMFLKYNFFDFSKTQKDVRIFYLFEGYQLFANLKIFVLVTCRGSHKIVQGATRGPTGIFSDILKEL